MQMKLMYHGEPVDCKKTGNGCGEVMCSRELMLKVLGSLVRPEMMPVIHRIFEVQELFQLADVSCLGENQLYHTIRMCEHIHRLKDSCLTALGVNREQLTTAALFHDSGKGKEIDDCRFYEEEFKPAKVPRKLKKYGVPGWAEYYSPLHDHVERSIEIAEAYDIEGEILEAVALHHHVKILPEVLKELARGLCLPDVIYGDILRFKPEQYTAKGCGLSQVIAALDQICAIERKFAGRVYVARDPEEMEDELAKELVIGVTDIQDPRVALLGARLEGNETVILFDIRGFGAFVQQNSEYKVQAIKKEILKTIRSVIRVQDRYRDKDLVSLVGGDEYALITKVKEPEIIDRMVNRIKKAIQNRTGMDVRFGFGSQGDIEANFHEARAKANSCK
ncbi:MAG: phosphohydrolase [Firmicutes bacterium HGW-Firmicutes-14]|nr:MAG: phosphohydrolase [Firmicutes bacterium HGW-Firmicutes-14]